ncbi:MAG: hypothetical protein JNL10_14550 [Verrucomicrobiales bacterium]|nr:hypothetical protein [Verrucomicrobiales bacterium]
MIRLLSATLFAILLVAAPRGNAAEARIRKVLPHLMDEKGRISTKPGLFDRDGYQQSLRQSPQRVSGIRFDVQWKAPREKRDDLVIRIELRTAKGEPGAITVVQAPTRDNRKFGGWSTVILKSEDYTRSGEVLAWRAVLLDGDRELAEQKSFLW